MNVSVVFAAFHEKAPVTEGFIENAPSTLLVFMLSLNLIVITELTETPVPVGEADTTVGGVVSVNSVVKLKE